MKIKQISKTEYEKIAAEKTTYFVNGCVFSEVTDNLIAFEHLVDDETFTFWVVINERICK